MWFLFSFVRSWLKMIVCLHRLQGNRKCLGAGMKTNANRKPADVCGLGTFPAVTSNIDAAGCLDRNAGLYQIACKCRYTFVCFRDYVAGSAIKPDSA